METTWQLASPVEVIMSFGVGIYQPWKITSQRDQEPCNAPAIFKFLLFYIKRICFFLKLIRDVNIVDIFNLVKVLEILSNFNIYWDKILYVNGDVFMIHNLVNL